MASSSPAVTIRDASADDIAHLGSVERSAAHAFLSLSGLSDLAEGPTMPEDDLRSALAEGCLIVATLQGKPDGHDVLVGFLAAQPLDSALHVAELSVVEEMQGKGIGRSLLEAVCQHAAAGVPLGQGRYDVVSLTTYREVPWNKPFYSRLGFEEVAAAALGPSHVEKMQSEAAAGLERQDWKRCCMVRRLSP